VSVVDDAAEAGPGRGSTDLRKADEKYLIRSLVRAISILKCFDVSRPSWRLIDLSRETGLDRGTCFRMVKTFESEGILALDEESGQYHLGRALVPAVYLVSSMSELARFAHPYVRKLADLTKETIALAVWTDDGVLFIDQVVTWHPFKLESTVGRTFTNWGISHMKIFAAFGPEKCKDRALTWNPSITGYPLRLKAAEAELEAISAQGIAYDLEENAVGICSVAAPVRDQSGQAIASLSVVAPVERFQPEQKRHHTESVLKVASELSRALGWVTESD
jgi:IclR family transcriptional regulator, KDG regulon repressor